MKKLFRILLATLIALTVMPLSISAEEDVDWSEYTQEEIALIQEQMKNNPEFDLSEGEIISIDRVRLQIEGDLQTKGVIGYDYMNLTIYVQRVSGDSGYDTLKIQAVADWLSVPFFNFTDGIALAWSDSFAQISHSCNAYYSNGYGSGRTRQVSSSPSAGVGYSVNFMNGQGNPLDYVVITAYVEKLDSSGIMTASVLYVHTKVSIGISFSFGIGGTVSFSSTGFTDQLAADVTFRY